MTVSNKLYAGFGLVIAMMAILTIVGIQRVGFIDKTLEEITDVNSVKQRYAINFRGSVHDRAIAIRDVVLFDDSKAVESVVQDIRELERFYAQSAKPLDQIFAQGENVTAQERAILQEIKSVESQTMPLVEEIISLTRSGNDVKAKEVLLQQASPAFTQWLGVINQFIDYQEDKNQKATPEARAVASGFTMLMVSLLLISTAIAISVVFFMTRFLNRSLGAEPQEVAHCVGLISKGDLTQLKANALPNSTMDAVNSMQEKLKEIVGHIKQASDALTDKSDSVAKSSMHTNDLAKNQVDISTKLSADIATISQEISEIVTIAQKTQNNSSQSATLAQKGTQAASSTAHKMEQVTQNVRGSADQVNMLEEHVKNISGSTALIQEVTEQTNLLALNAAIEAARAGEAGRGFAVVAEEIRKLAEKTDKTTDEITRMVKLIQNETTSAVGNMNRVVEDVESSFELANDTAQMLEEIYTQTNDSLSYAKQTAKSSSSQAQSVQKLAEDITLIANSSKSTSDSMQSNAKTVEELKKIASDLQSLINFFKS